jgi:hypothetical protein
MFHFGGSGHGATVHITGSTVGMSLLIAQQHGNMIMLHFGGSGHGATYHRQRSWHVAVNLKRKANFRCSSDV